MTTDEIYMRQTFSLARQGVGKVNPNPLVGSIIVKNGHVIGQGYHAYYGGPHAEVAAIADAQEDVKGASLYVNLEPCSHYGKTPPCAELIIQKGISRVVVAMRDPNPLVAGKGIHLLKEAGIEVVEGVLQQEAEYLNRIFIKYITTKKPYVLMKSAMTLDGKIATRVGDSCWVSGVESRNYVHQLRNEFMGIMVGINTVLSDNPQLTCRMEGDSRNPIRIVVDSSARIPTDCHLFNVEHAPTVVVHASKASAEKIDILHKCSLKTILTFGSGNKVNVEEMMTALGEMGIDGILLEGGGTLNFSLLESGCVDEILFFIAPKIVGGEHSRTPVEGKGVNLMREAFMLNDVDVERIGDDIMVRALIKKQ